MVFNEKSYRWNVLYTIIFSISFIDGSNALGSIHKRDLRVITLQDGRMTTGHRTNPIPQLQCTSNCRYKPQVVQCFNRGFDGMSNHWECKANLPSGVSFGNMKVSCEGYSYVGDPQVTVGSCGLTYSLVGSNYATVSKTSEPGTIYTLLFYGIIFAMFYYLLKSCTAPVTQYGGNDDSTDDQYRRAGFDGGSFGSDRGFPPGGPGFRPNFYNSGDTCGANRNTGMGGQPGFWSGAAAGGLLGYLFSRGANTGYGGHYEDTYRRQARGYDEDAATSSGYEATGFATSEDR